MKKYASLLLLFFFILVACKMNSTVLAEYRGGKITSSDFYEWLNLQEECPTCGGSGGGFNAKEIQNGDPEVKKNLLEMYFLNKVINEEVKNKGLDKTDEYRFATEQGTEAFFEKTLYKKLILDNVKFSEPAVRISQIYLAVNPVKNVNGKVMPMPVDEINAEYDKAMARGEGIIASLNKGANFAELVKINSSIKDTGNGGDIGYQTKGTLPANYAEAAFSLKDGESSKKPIKVLPSTARNTPIGVYIIKVTEKKEINEKNIDKLIPNKAIQAAIFNSYAGPAESQYIKNLQSASDVEVHYDKIGSKNKNDLLFKVADIRFTEADLDRLINLNYKRMEDDPRIEKLPVISVEQKRVIVQNEYFYNLLKRDADNKGITKDPEFIKKVNAEKENQISQEYVRQYTKGIKVTEDEMRKVFKANIDKPSEKAYQSSKNEIRMSILLGKKSEKSEKLRTDLKNAYAFKIYEDKLK
jgi:parvulin-like peptidyl-prolyl isomerase